MDGDDSDTDPLAFNVLPLWEDNQIGSQVRFVLAMLFALAGPNFRILRVIRIRQIRNRSRSIRVLLRVQLPPHQMFPNLVHVYFIEFTINAISSDIRPVWPRPPGL